jgi:DNA-directed RNA polymerase subunit E'/Rpb7
MNEDLFEIKHIERTLILHPDQLNYNYKDIIYDLIQKDCVNSCIKEIGYVKQIIKIQKIVYDEIMKMTPNIFIKVLIEIECYLPKIGDHLQIRVELVFNHGIFANFNKIKVLVPIYNCQEYELIQDFTETYLQKKNSLSKIKKNDIIYIEITNLRFEKENFSCLGKIL